jgi:hypothetical protein
VCMARASIVIDFRSDARVVGVSCRRVLISPVFWISGRDSGPFDEARPLFPVHSLSLAPAVLASFPPKRPSAHRSPLAYFKSPLMGRQY